MNKSGKTILTVATMSVALNAALLARFLIRHHRAIQPQIIPDHPKSYISSDAVDSRIFDERSSRFTSLKRQPVDVLFVGDSIAAFLVNDLEDRQREGDVPAKWNSLSVHERSIPGITTTGLLSILPAIEIVPAKTIILWVGTNDIGTGKRPADQIAVTYDNIVADLQKHCPSARIVILSVLPVRFNDDWNAETKRLNSLLVGIAGQRKCQYLNVTGDVIDAGGRLDESITVDGVHPTASALLRIERQIASALSSTEK
jgi:lysophospholipase L1-like esterase